MSLVVANMTSYVISIKVYFLLPLLHKGQFFQRVTKDSIMLYVRNTDEYAWSCPSISLVLQRQKMQQTHWQNTRWPSLFPLSFFASEYVLKSPSSPCLLTFFDLFMCVGCVSSDLRPQQFKTSIDCNYNKNTWIYLRT